MQLLQTLVLGGKSTFARRVHDQHRLVAILIQGNGVALIVGELQVINSAHALIVPLHREYASLIVD